MKNYIFRILTLTLFAGVFLASCKEDDESLSPKVAEISPMQGASNALLTIKGTDISDVRTIVFEKGNIKADVVPTFNTDKALLLRVPADAVPGEQNIILTNKNGTEFKVAFNVLGFASITSVSNYNFKADSEITLTGKNLDDVTSVVFTGTTTEVTIVSKTATSLTLKFPATTLTESTLDITNKAGVAKTTQSFVALDNALQLFTDDYGPGYQDGGSWGGGVGISTTVFKSGAASVYKDFAKSNWHLIAFGWTATPNDNYKYLSFWIKGGSITYDLYIGTEASEGGVGSFNEYDKITVPANEWTYFKLPVGPLKLWDKKETWNQIGWRIKGPDAQDERFYLDDVILVK